MGAVEYECPNCDNWQHSDRVRKVAPTCHDCGLLMKAAVARGDAPTPPAGVLQAIDDEAHIQAFVAAVVADAEAHPDHD